MSNVKVVCWSLLAVLGVYAIEPATVGATATEDNKISPNILRIDNPECLTRLTRLCLDSQPLLANRLIAQSTTPRPSAVPAPTPTIRTSPTPTPSVASPKPTPAAIPTVIQGNLELFGGRNIPTSVRLRELSGEWRALGTNGPLELGNFQMLVNSSAGGSFAATYYTKGQTITVGTETYVVAYSLFTLVDKVTPEIPLSLSLLNLKTVGSFSNIRPFDVGKETKVLEKQLAMIKLSNVWDPTKAAEPEPSYRPEPSETVKPAPGKKPVRKNPRTRTRRSR
jgi:hypothetical protein